MAKKSKMPVVPAPQPVGPTPSGRKRKLSAAVMKSTVKKAVIKHLAK